MGASLSDLPFELLLELASQIEEIRNFALTCKIYYLISVVELLRRAEEDDLTRPLKEACRALRCMRVYTLGLPERLLDKAYRKIQNRVVQYIDNGKPGLARIMLRLVEQLPSDTRIPEDYFLAVDEILSARDW